MNGSSLATAFLRGTRPYTSSPFDLQLLASLPQHLQGTPGEEVASWNIEVLCRLWNSSGEWVPFHGLNDGVERGRRFPSIQEAIHKAQDGFVVLEPGVYVEDLYIDRSVHLMSASGAQRASILGHIVVNASQVTLDGISFSATNRSRPVVTVARADSVSIVNCRFIGKKELKSMAEDFVAPAVFCGTCSRLRFVNNFVKEWTTGLTIVGSSNIIMQSNSFSSCVTALNILSCPKSNLHLVRNLFTKNAVAIQLKERCEEQAIEHNIFDGNLRIVMIGDEVAKGVIDLETPVSSVSSPALSVVGLGFDISVRCSKEIDGASLVSAYPWLEAELQSSSCAHILLSSPHSPGKSKHHNDNIYNTHKYLIIIINIIYLFIYLLLFQASSTYHLLTLCCLAWDRLSLPT